MDLGVFFENMIAEREEHMRRDQDDQQAPGLVWLHWKSMELILLSYSI